MLPRVLVMLVPILVFAGCVPLSPRNPMATWRPSKNHDVRRAQLIVLHFTDEPSVEDALKTLRTHNSGGPVSAHYLIGSGGHIYQLVRDRQRAWHAGSGRWGTITDVNSASIGIELDNDGHEPFPHEQIDSLLRLLTDLTSRLDIPRTQIIGHEDFAPARKVDPGPLFPWALLAKDGFGLWPDARLCDPPPGFDPWAAMAVIGYPLANRGDAVRSFHHHFRGMQGKILDPEDLRILYNLEQKIESGAVDENESGSEPANEPVTCTAPGRGQTPATDDAQSLPVATPDGTPLPKHA